jgi:hypothetical protein
MSESVGQSNGSRHTDTSDRTIGRGCRHGKRSGLSLTGDVGYGAYRTGADVWRSLPDMVVGDVCAQARSHLHRGHNFHFGAVAGV